MTSTAWAITIGYSVLAILFTIIGLIVFRSTRVGFKVDASSREKLEKRENYWGVAVVAFLVVVLGGTILQIPYWQSKNAGAVPQTVHVTGRQFAWTIDPPRLKANVKTRFVLKSADVAHGFGLYNGNDTLIKQVQVGPGVTQNIVMTLKPGKYTVRCLEFCGLDHHLMETTVQVTR